MGTLNRFNISALVGSGVTTLVETGTGQGRSVWAALDNGIKSIYTVESYKPLFEQAQQTFASYPGVHIAYSDSVDFLKMLPPSPTPTVYFLDAHFIGGVDFNPSQEAKEKSALLDRSFPLEQELEVLLTKDISNDWIIIDDARLYLEEDFESGKCPQWAQQWKRWETLAPILARFNDTHTITTLYQDEGYWVLAPKQSKITITY